MARSVLFPYQPLERAVDDYWREARGYRQAYAAWQMFKGVVLINSIVHYGVKPSSTPYMAKKALHMSWEDACVTLRGHGDNSMTGPLLSMWVNMYNEAERVKLGQIMNGKLVEVYTKADALGYRHRYEETYRVGPVVIDDTKFTGQVVIPISGGKMSRWAYDNGIEIEFARELLMDAMSQKQAMYQAEKEAQDAKDDAAFEALMNGFDPSPPTPTPPSPRDKFRVLSGGKT